MNRKRVVSQIFNNLPYKILAVFLAVAFWYVVQSNEILEVNTRIRVSIQVPDGMMIKGATTRTKDATMSGPRVFVSTVADQELEAVIRIPKGKTGQLRYRIDKEYIRNWDPRVKLTVHDAYLTVIVDEKETRRVPVEETIKGRPATGYMVEKTVVKPAFVEVTGLKSEISSIKSIPTEAVDIAGLQQNKTLEAKLDYSDLSLSEISTDKVEVTFAVGEKSENKRFGTVPIKVVGTDRVSSVKPRYVTIVIQGTPAVLSFIRSTDLEATVDARDLEPGSYQKAIQVKIPPDTVLIETFPERTTLAISERKKAPKSE